MNARPVEQEVDAQVRKREDGVHTIVDYSTNLEKSVVKKLGKLGKPNRRTERLAL
jgi:hypothetical protein